MRLIDADVLKEEIEFHPTSVSVCMTVAEAKGQTYFKNRCLEDIDNAPTVDAIPVSWICGWIRNEENTRNYKTAQYLTNMIWEWHQEANDEEDDVD